MVMVLVVVMGGGGSGDDRGGGGGDGGDGSGRYGDGRWWLEATYEYIGQKVTIMNPLCLPGFRITGLRIHFGSGSPLLCCC